MKNITKKKGVRIGSRAWFAAREWTIQRSSWNECYPDVIMISDGELDLVFQENQYGWYASDLGATECMGDCLREDLLTFVGDIAEELEDDDEQELNLRLAYEKEEPPPLPNLEKAEAFGQDWPKVLAYLRESAKVLVSEYRRTFGIGDIPDEQNRCIHSLDRTLRLQWQLRSDPDAPESYENQQTSVGTVVFYKKRGER